MSIYLYDEAIVQKLKAVFPHVEMGTADTYEETDAARNDAKFTLPVIGINRLSPHFDKGNENHLQIFRGRYENKTQDNQYTIYPSFPITVSYQFDVIATSRRECDSIFGELIWFLKLYPSVKFTVLKPYSWTCYDASFQLDDINDNTDINSFVDRGREYRLTLDATLINAVLLHVVGYQPVQQVEVQIEVDNV